MDAAANILASRDGILKIADFGTATSFKARDKFHSEVCTLWYRPPELLMGETHYGHTVDIWAMACLFVELCSNSNFLRGKDENEQLEKIFAFFGTPHKDQYFLKLPYASKLNEYPQHTKEKFASQFNSALYVFSERL